MLILILTVALGAIHQGPNAVQAAAQPNWYQHSGQDMATTFKELIEPKSNYYDSSTQPSDQPKSASEWLIAWSSAIQAISAVVVAALTVFLVIYTRGLLTSTHDTVNAAIQSANAASASADAAKASLAINKEIAAATIANMHAEHRAWIGVVGVDEDALLEVNGYMRPKVRVTNTGRSAAVSVDARYRVSIVPVGLEHIPEPPRDHEPTSDLAVIAHGDTVTLVVPPVGPLTKEHLSDLQTRAMHFAVYGEIHYTDALRTSGYTRFCFVWPGVTPGWKTGDIRTFQGPWKSYGPNEMR
jgi:hypothetical protein